MIFAFLVTAKGKTLLAFAVCGLFALESTLNWIIPLPQDFGHDWQMSTPYLRCT